MFCCVAVPLPWSVAHLRNRGYPRHQGWQNLPANLVRGAVQNMHKRVRSLAAAKGDLFE